jgi:hypothetical protein
MWWIDSKMQILDVLPNHIHNKTIDSDLVHAQYSFV